MFKMTFQVDYIDTDAMGVVHHASYFRWFERCRVEWLRELGMSYLEMEKEGYLLPLRSAGITYKKPLYFDDHPEIQVCVGKLRSAGIDLLYRIYRNGELATEGSTSHVICLRTGEGANTKLSPVRLPEKWRTVWQEQSEKKF